MHEKILEIVVDRDEISWKSIIQNLVSSGEIDPWDVDISLLTQKYLERLRTYKEANLKVSGKVLLAAALLLKIKSRKLVGEDISDFDRLLAGDVSSDEFYDSLEQELARGEAVAIAQNIELVPRSPMPRKRKVSVYDLVRALEKALEVKKRRVLQSIRDADVDVPREKFDIGAAIMNLWSKIKMFFTGGQERIAFSQLVSGPSKKDKIHTFIPLLHLSNEQKVELEQKEHFGEIYVAITGKGSEVGKNAESG